MRNRIRHDPRPAPAPACPVPSRRGDGQRVVRPPLPGYVHAVGQHSERLWPGWRMADKAFLYSDGRSTWVADAEGRAQRTTAAGDSDPDLDLSYAFRVTGAVRRCCCRSAPRTCGAIPAIARRWPPSARTAAFHRYAQEDWPGLRKPGGYRGDLAARPAPAGIPLCPVPVAAPGPAHARAARQLPERRPGLAAPLARSGSRKAGWRRRSISAKAPRAASRWPPPRTHRFRRGSATLSAGAAEYALAFYDAKDRRRRRQRSLRDRRALAGVLLDLRDDDADWKEAATAGTWPLDYLLRDQPPAWSELPDDARARGERYRREMGATRQRLVELRRPSPTRRPLLVIPQPRRTIGFATAASEVRGGFTSLADGPFRQAYLGARWNVGERPWTASTTWRATPRRTARATAVRR
ncbi:hypothetical protein P4114_25585 [Pseudomonas aeruginosa]|nr:hypothetical protein [Pseudomonas aeruginosa]